MNEPPTQLIDDLRLLQAPAPWWVWVLALVALIGLCVVGIFVWRRWRSKPRAVADRGGAETAHEDALADLETARKLMASGDSKPYGVEVSRIVRRYIEVRFGLVAPRRSTEEFLVEAQFSARLQPGHRLLLAKLLGVWDLFKFGRTHGEMPELISLHDAAVGFVTETRVVRTSRQAKELV